MADLNLNVSDLDLNEVDEIEDEFGLAISEIDFKRAKHLRFLVWVFMKRENPEATLEDAGKIKLTELDPTPARKGGGRGGRSSAKQG